jgi:homoserine kinase
MRFAADQVVVSVPATSANLGPGFDSVGLALDLWDQVKAKALSGHTSRVTVRGEGAGQLPTDGDHLVVRAAQRALELAGAPPVALELDCLNAIPQGKGLGSSASAVVAGAMIARGLIANPAAMNAGRVFQLAAGFEGHPDNAAPAVFGGATVAWTKDSSSARAARLRVHPDVRAVVLIPDKPVATTLARAALPAKVPFRDAAFNASRAALLVHALADEPALLFEATEDHIHQPYRAQIMPKTAQLVADLRALGLAAVISGAGPAVLVLATDPATVPEPPGWRWRAMDVARRGASVARAGRA